jgi:hypothetical protein
VRVHVLNNCEGCFKFTTILPNSKLDRYKLIAYDSNFSFYQNTGEIKYIMKVSTMKRNRYSIR